MSAFPAISSRCPRKARLAAIAAAPAMASRRGTARRRTPGSAATAAERSRGNVAIAPIQENRPAAIVAKA